MSYILGVRHPTDIDVKITSFLKINNKHMQIILPPTDFPRTVLYVKFRIKDFDKNNHHFDIYLAQGHKSEINNN
jgi:hypothetical protein